MLSSSDPGQSRIDLLRQVHELRWQVERLDARLERTSAELADDLRTLLEAVELVFDDDRRARRSLRKLRASPEYDTTFATSDPLVSVVIPTWNRESALLERSIPSALGQTHRNVEVIVVGDASPPATVTAVASIDDPRVSFHNLTIRGPYDDDPRRAWQAAGTPGFNAGVALARGLWIAPLGDDDAFVPDHIERLLHRARADRLEFVYGRLRRKLPDEGAALLGEFPPRYGEIGLQAAIYLRGLRFMELELGHSIFNKPNDWGLIHRMMRVGVRMGMVGEVSVNYWPSANTPPPSRADRMFADHGVESERLVDEARSRALELEARLGHEVARSQELEQQLGDLARRLESVVQSRSWRMTAPLRRIRARN